MPFSLIIPFSFSFFTFFVFMYTYISRQCIYFSLHCPPTHTHTYIYLRNDERRLETIPLKFKTYSENEKVHCKYENKIEYVISVPWRYKIDVCTTTCERVNTCISTYLVVVQIRCNHNTGKGDERTLVHKLKSLFATTLLK